MNKKLLNILRLCGIVEGISMLVLLYGSYLKHASPSENETLVRIMGPIHGLLFVAYVMLCFQAVFGVPLRAKTAAIAAIGSILPLGPFIVDIIWLNSKRVEAEYFADRAEKADKDDA